MIRKLARLRSLRLIDTVEGPVLLRSDGLIVAISQTARDLFKNLERASEEESLRQLELQHGKQEAQECLHEISELVEQGILGEGADGCGSVPVELDQIQPSGILMMVSQTCNLACRYCYAGGGSYGSAVRFMSEDRAERVVDLLLARAPDKKRYTVIFFGGEPLLNFRLIRHVVEYCQRRAEERSDLPLFQFSLTTNGTVLTGEILRFLKDHEFVLMVSFDGRGFHSAHRPFKSGRSSEEVVLKNVARLTDAGIPVQLRATLMPEMIDEGVVADLVSVGGELGVERIVTAPADGGDSGGCGLSEGGTKGCGASDLLRLAEVYAAVTESNLGATAQDDLVLFDPHVDLMKALARGRAVGSRRCGACFSMSAVATDGTIYPCHRFVGMRPYSIGTVADGFDPGRIRRFFASVGEADADKCSSCWAQDLCGGVCFHHRADGVGGFRAPSPEDCETFRRSLDKSVGFLMSLGSMTPEARRTYMRRVRHL